MTDTMPPPADDPRWAQLRAVFPPALVEKKPQQVVSREEANRPGGKQKCQRGSNASADGYFCGGYHARSIHIDYVGHAGITDRLNEVDPAWTIEPAALDPSSGIPLASHGGMWFRMTVLGVTRWCFGDAQGKDGPAATKELIGDAIRNGAMRFGLATYLWSKSEEAEAKKRGETPDEAPRVTEADVLARAAGATDLDALRGVWQLARTAGVLTPNVEAVIEERRGALQATGEDEAGEES